MANGVDYDEREITYKDEPRTLYTFEFGDGIRIEAYAREVDGDKPEILLFKKG